MNDIYTDELKHLYQQQTDIRDLLKNESTELMKKLTEDVSVGRSADAETIELMLKLHGQLQSAKGKKVYGYLKKDVKQTVDDIFFRLSQNESIQKMYRLWCDMEQTKHDFYSSAKAEVEDKEHEERKTGIQEEREGRLTVLVFPQVHAQQRIDEH